MNTSNPCCAGGSKASAEGAATDPESIRAQVRDGYAKRATQAAGCCGADPASAQHARSIGYSEAELQTVPEESNLGLGCGNPLAYAAPKAGETVLDLGSGAGFDAFLAAAAVGAGGRVIGVDMTDEMIAKARANATKSGHANVEFRHGLIEELPVETGTVDVVTSNCVINLSPQKDRVFAEAFRVLRPGGRLVVSDIVLTEPLPEVVRGDLTAYIACLAGASLRNEYLDGVRGAGFVDVEVVQETRVADTMVSSDADDPLVASLAARLDADQLRRLADSVRSVKVFARKPPLSSCGCTVR